MILLLISNNLYFSAKNLGVKACFQIQLRFDTRFLSDLVIYWVGCSKFLLKKRRGAKMFKLCIVHVIDFLFTLSRLSICSQTNFRNPFRFFSFSAIFLYSQEVGFFFDTDNKNNEGREMICYRGFDYFYSRIFLKNRYPLRYDRAMKFSVNLVGFRITCWNLWLLTTFK